MCCNVFIQFKLLLFPFRHSSCSSSSCLSFNSFCLAITTAKSASAFKHAEEAVETADLLPVELFLPTFAHCHLFLWHLAYPLYWVWCSLSWNLRFILCWTLSTSSSIAVGSDWGRLRLLFCCDSSHSLSHLLTSFMYCCSSWCRKTTNFVYFVHLSWVKESKPHVI